MKIAIDASQIIYGTGVSRYTKHLVKNLLVVDKKNDYCVFGGSLRRYQELNDELKGLFRDSHTTVSGSYRTYPMPPMLSDFVWNTLHFLPIEALLGRVDVFHSSDWSQPKSSAFKVTTIHDLAPLIYPEFTDPNVVSAHKRRLSWVKREVDRIIVPTNAVKSDLTEHGFDEGKIRVVYEGVDPAMKPQPKAKVDKIKKKYAVPGKYLLAVGVNKRKNTEAIIDAFKKINDKGLYLVIIGRQHSDVTGAPRVIFTGHVSDSDLGIFYSGAEALLYPSLYEGFGLPILDAFSCSTPVVTSNRGSMKEVAGDACVLVDPESVSSIVSGIKNAMKDRKTLVRKGKSRVKKFSWEKAARETLRVYEELS